MKKSKLLKIIMKTVELIIIIIKTLKDKLP